MDLEFGIFDIFERLPDMPDAQQYAERIELVAHAEAHGFYGYHFGEHHLSPLSMAPSPLVFLSALSQRTSRIRLGAMVVIVPLYHPIRLTQEICMVDAISGGRLELGVGRGIRDRELEWFGHDPTESRHELAVALERVRAALYEGRIEVEAPAGEVRFAPLVREPTQKPTPPFWYVGNSAFAAEQGMSVLAHRPSRAQAEEFRSTWDTMRRAGSRLHQGPQPRFGTTRPVYVASSERAAESVARRAWLAHEQNFFATDTLSGGKRTPRDPAGFRGGVERAVETGDLAFGTPERVRALLGDVVASVGPAHNYLLSSFQWGDISHEEARSSLELFATHVAPALRQRHRGR